MFEEFDLQALRRVPQFAHYFRYPLRHQDFHEAPEQERLLGRMNATMRLASYTTIPLGSLLAGFLGSAVGLRPALLIGAAGFALPVLCILISPIPGLRDLKEASQDVHPRA